MKNNNRKYRCWCHINDDEKAYDKLYQIRYEHFNVIHSEDFVDISTGRQKHTLNHILNLLKKMLNMGYKNLNCKDTSRYSDSFKTIGIYPSKNFWIF